MRIKSPEHVSVLRKSLGILGAALLTVTMNSDKQAHPPPERVHALSLGHAVLYEPPHIITESPTTEPTTTVTLPSPSTTETQPLPTQDTTPTDPPADQEWQPPEGCLVPMGPLEAKSEEEAHRCWDGLLALYPWPQTEAFSVMYCESKGNPYADNPNSTAEGLMQVLGGSDDPRTNMDQAIRKYQASDGWDQWSCRP